MYVLNNYKTKVYVYLNLDKTSTNNLASNVCLELLQVYIYLNLDKTSTNNLASNVCLEFLKYWYFTYSLTRQVLTTSLVMYVLNYYKTQVYVYLNLDKTSTNNLASNVCLEFLKYWLSYFCITGDQ
jgi:hypothetical protein